jgi:NADP-dependent 3-hydroxy acid dehydrogenase YdfG
LNQIISSVVPVDVRDKNLIDNMLNKTLEKFKRVDVLVNNAGGGNATVPPSNDSTLICPKNGRLTVHLV